MTPEICGRCSEPLDTTGTPRWCKACRASYQRGYHGMKLDRQERKGFAKGRDAMRAMVVEEFERLGYAGFTSSEVAELVRRMPGPQLDEETEEVAKAV